MSINEFSLPAFHAIRAARIEKCIGARMARIYARNNGCFRLYLLARMLENSN
jgi:hypothetical protein